MPKDLNQMAARIVERSTQAKPQTPRRRTPKKVSRKRQG
jgi:hypothetical protein